MSVLKKFNCILQFWPRWRHRQQPFASSHSQKEDKNQSKISKQAEAPENQTAWNSNNQGIKENINQNNQTGKAADQAGGADLRGKLRLRAHCGHSSSCHSGRNSQSHTKSFGECTRHEQWAAPFPLWPLSHRQRCSTARRVAPPW